MFDGWIDMGPLAQAFNLTDVQCIELAKRVSWRFGPERDYEEYGLEEIDSHAKAYAHELISNPDQRAAYCVYYRAMNARSGDTHQSIDVAWDAGYKALWDRGEMKEAFAILWPITRLYFIADLQVDRDSAVRFLDKEGYSFQKDVKGLSRAIVDGVLRETALAPAEDNTEPHIILVPRSLWEGKTHATVRHALRPKGEYEGFSDAVIAYVLFNWCGLKNKTQIGRLLGSPDQNDSTSLRQANTLLEEAEKLEIHPA